MGSLVQSLMKSSPLLTFKKLELYITNKHSDKNNFICTRINTAWYSETQDFNRWYREILWSKWLKIWSKLVIYKNLLLNTYMHLITYIYLYTHTFGWLVFSTHFKEFCKRCFPETNNEVNKLFCLSFILFCFVLFLCCCFLLVVVLFNFILERRLKQEWLWQFKYIKILKLYLNLFLITAF